MERHPFHFYVVDECPIRQSPCTLLEDEKEWVRKYMENQVELGVLEQLTIADPPPTFICNIVLVKEGQSG